MKILQLCKKFPFPLKDGESLAVTYLAKAMHELGNEVTLLSMNTSKHYFDTEKLPKWFNHYNEIHTAFVDNQLKAKDAFLNLFSTQSYHISRFFSKDFNQKLIDLLKAQTFDVIQLETLYLAPYIDTIRKYSKAKIALRAHNIEHEIWDRIAYNTSNVFKKGYLKYLVRKLKRYEVAQLDKIDFLVPITDRDLKIFRKLGYTKSAQTTQIGMDLMKYRPNFNGFKRPISVSFIGSLDWMPNQEGLVWFLKEVWPSVIKKYPNLKLHIAGRNTPEWIIKKASKNIVIHGEVPEANTFINQHSLMVVPLLSGSGMRVKILEGMALGRVVLTTSMGLEGIAAQDQKQILIANDPKAFFNYFDHCMQNPNDILEIGEQARYFIERNYEYKQIAKAVLDQYNLITPQLKEA